MKPYVGTLYRRGHPVKNRVRFYDEHEWRYVPSNNIMKRYEIPTFIPRDTCMDPVALEHENRKLEIDQTRLTFNPNDIKYVIIRDESEINTMVKKLRKIKGGIGFDDDTVDRLTSRIITVKQIRADF